MIHGSAANAPPFGALVISLDFELHWGVRDWAPIGSPYTANLMGARTAVPQLLALFEEFDVAATWATVGFLFAEGRDDLDRFRPSVLPRYLDHSLYPYDEPVGSGEVDDPLHFGSSLIELVRATPRQELGSHTHSHYYCLEPGQGRDAFVADTRSAVGIARERQVELRSLVFPRNQVNEEYLDDVRTLGLTCYRGAQRGLLYGSHAAAGWNRRSLLPRRALRLLDSYVNVTGHATTGWGELIDRFGLCNIPASQFLRPYTPQLRHLEPLRVRRVLGGLAKAAKAGRIFHLWWHPHNHGVHLEENLATLRRVLEGFSTLRDTHDMRSMTMSEVAAAVSTGRHGTASPPPVR